MLRCAVLGGVLAEQFGMVGELREYGGREGSGAGVAVGERPEGAERAGCQSK
jgi:hypothetical protein